jgi:hypothetical protein
LTCDLAASVRQRLLNEAHAQGRPFQEFLQYYAMERFLYRLSKSGYAETFSLKGALKLFLPSRNSPYRRCPPRQRAAHSIGSGEQAGRGQSEDR